MRTWLMLPGAGGAGWYWHLVAERLRADGDEVLTPDLPAGDDEAGIAEYAEAARRALGGRARPMVVGQSLGGMTAAEVALRVPSAGLVFLNAMIPAVGERPGDWWAASGRAAAKRAADVAAGRGGPELDGVFDPDYEFLHDLSPELVAEAQVHQGPQSDAVFDRPWALDRWPDAPVTVIVGRDDRFFPVEFQRRLARERAGVEAVVVPGGHLAALSAPDAVCAALRGAARSAALGPLAQ